MWKYYGKNNIILDGFIASGRTLAFMRRVAVDGSLETLILTYYKSSKHKSKFAGKFLLLITLLLSSIALLVSLFSFSIGRLSGIPVSLLDTYSWFLYYMSPIIPMMFIISFLNGILAANRYIIIPSIAIFLGNVFNVIAFRSNYLTNGLELVAGSLLYSLVPIIIMMYLIRPYVSWPNTLWLDKEEKDFLIVGFKNTILQNFTGLSDYYSHIKAIQLGSGFISTFEFCHKILFFFFSIIAAPISSLFSVKNFDVPGEERLENTKRSFMLIHILAIFPCMILFFYSEAVILMLFDAGSNNIVETLSTSAIYLYFMMQTKLLNTLLLVNKKVTLTNIASIVFALVNFLSVYMYHSSLVQISWGCNIATFIQFLLLLFFAMKNRLLKFKRNDIFHLLWAIISSATLSYIIKILPHKIDNYIAGNFGTVIKLLNKFLGKGDVGLISIVVTAIVAILLIPLYLALNYRYTKYLFRRK